MRRNIQEFVAITGSLKGTKSRGSPKEMMLDGVVSLHGMEEYLYVPETGNDRLNTR